MKCKKKKRKVSEMMLKWQVSPRGMMKLRLVSRHAGSDDMSSLVSDPP